MTRSGSGGTQSPAPVIAYLVGTFPGITETFILREIQSLRERNFHVVVCAIRRPDLPDVERTLLSGGFESIETIYARPDRLHRHLWTNLKALGKAPRRYLRTLGTFMGEFRRLRLYDIGRVLYHFYCGIGFLDTFKHYGIQHLHAHFTAGSSIALAARMYGGYSFSFSAHASGDIYRDAVLLEEKVAQATLVMAVCEYNRRYLDSVTGYRYSQKLLRVYNGVDVEEPRRLAAAGERAKYSEERVGRIVSVGSLVRMKGHATVVLACKQLEGSGFEFVCDIIGEGPERGVLERLIEESRLEGRVRLAGAQPLRAVYEALEKADLFVLLSEIDIDGYRDGFPTVILEAMAMNLPVVSTWVSGIPEMVEPEVTGFLVPERDAKGAANAIAKLLVSADLRRAMGSAGRKKLKEQFNSDEIADLRAELLQKIVKF